MSDDLKGTVFNGRYTILERIGAGGMATVYRARDERSSHFVAIKILSREFLDRNPKEAERNLRRFKREADILKLLNGSPHVVGYVEHACSEAGDWFIAMELLEGEQLSRSIGRGRDAMPIHNFLHHGVHLVQGLKEIHARKIVHRDLAPDNVIIVKNEEGIPIPKFLDFGIGKSLDNELDQVTHMLTIMGKPQYFSPEQARGVELTSASDVYSLGVVLYQLVTGHVPLEIRGIPDFKKIQKEPPIAIESYREGQRIPGELQDVITRCLAKTPEDRPLLDEVLSILESVRARANAGEELAATGDDTGPTADYTAPVRVQTEMELGEGTKVNRYEISRLLGRGGMGAVYEAWDPQLQRKVALKIASQVEEQGARNRLLKEARASAALRSENIVTIYDVGTDGGTPFIAMEFVDGKTLAQVIEEEGPLSGSRFWEIASGLCAGLELAHDRKQPVVHRDLKPANVLVHRHVAKIADFGIAKVSKDAGSPSGPDTGGHDVGGGTAATMSPEQINEQPTDHRSDLYSLGCVLYMMATGRGPYRGNQIAIIYQHCNAEPTPPSKVIPGVPAELDKIILKLLEKDPDDRYADAAGVLEDLRGVYAPQEQVARPWYRSPLPIAACVAIIAAGITLALSLNGGGGGGGGESAFGLKFVGASGFTSGRTYYTNADALRLVGAGPSDGELFVEITPDGGEPITLDPVTFSRTFEERIPLKPAPKAAIGYSISVGLVGSDADPTTFRLIQDPSPPVVTVKTHGRPERQLLSGGQIIALSGDDIEIIVTEPDSGFGDPENPTKSWKWGDADFEGIKVGRNGDQIVVQITNLAGGGVNTRYPVVTHVPSLQEKGLSFVTRRSSYDLDVRITCADFDLDAEPLRDGDLTAALGAREFPLNHDGGRYKGTVELPAGDGPATEAHSVTLKYRGEPTGDTIVITHDTAPPALTLEHRPAGNPTRTFSLDDPPTDALDKRSGELMSKLFAVTASDAHALRGTAAITYGNAAEAAVTIARDGTIALPDNLPADRLFDVVVSVRDEADNLSELRFKVNMIGTSVSSISVGGREPVQGKFWVPRSVDLTVTVNATGTTPEDTLLVAVIDGNDKRTGEPVEMTRAGAAFSVSGMTLGGTARAVRILRRATDGREDRIATYAIAVDTKNPTRTIAVHGETVTMPGTIETAMFPNLTIMARDDAGLDARESDLTIEGPTLMTALEPRDGGADWIVTAPDGAVGKWTLTFRTTDHSGRQTPPFRLTVNVTRPVVYVTKVGALETDEKRPRQFVDGRRVPIKGTSLDLKVAKSTNSGRIHLRARVLPNGPVLPIAQSLTTATPVGVRLRELAETDGTVVLEWYEKVAGDAVSPAIPFEEITWVRDGIEPTWSLWKDGERIGLSPTVLSTTGLKVTRLDSVSLRLDDDGGFAQNPVHTGENTLPDREPPEHLGNRVIWRFKAEPDWVSKTVNMEIKDLAGHVVPVRFTLYAAVDDLQVEAVSGAGGSLPRHGDAYVSRSRDITIALVNDAEDVVAVQVEAADAALSVALDKNFPVTGRRATASVQLPGDGLFTLRLKTEKGTTGVKDDPFATLKILIDSAAPNITLRHAGVEIGATIEVKTFAAFSVAAEDGGGLALVEFAVGKSGDAFVYERFSLSSGSGGIYQVPSRSITAPSVVLSVRATDLAGNENTRSSTVTIKRAAPALPKFSAKTIKSAYGIDTIPIPNADRPLFFVAETELSVGQLNAIWKSMDADKVIAAIKRRPADFGVVRSDVARLKRARIEEVLRVNQDGRLEDAGPATNLPIDVAVAIAYGAGNGRIPTREQWVGMAGRYRDRAATDIVILDSSGNPLRSSLLTRKKYGNYNQSSVVAVTKASRGNPFKIIGLAGNVSEWVVDRRAGTMGGSVRDKYDHKTLGASLTREPNREPSAINKLGAVGMRIVWPAR